LNPMRNERGPTRKKDPVVPCSSCGKPLMGRGGFPPSETVHSRPTHGSGGLAFLLVQVLGCRFQGISWTNYESGCYGTTVKESREEGKRAYRCSASVYLADELRPSSNSFTKAFPAPPRSASNPDFTHLNVRCSGHVSVGGFLSFQGHPVRRSQASQPWSYTCCLGVADSALPQSG